jgi:hypothetical protein
MDTTSQALFSVMDELEKAIKPYRCCPCIHSRKAAGLIMDALLNAHYVLIQGERHALPSSRKLPY